MDEKISVLPFGRSTTVSVEFWLSIVLPLGTVLKHPSICDGKPISVVIVDDATCTFPKVFNAKMTTIGKTAINFILKWIALC